MDEKFGKYLISRLYTLIFITIFILFVGGLIGYFVGEIDSIIIFEAIFYMVYWFFFLIVIMPIIAEFYNVEHNIDN